MGQDYYESPDRGTDGTPALGIGHDTVIERTIVDKNARIGDGVRITPDGKPSFLDGANFYVREGIVIIPKNAVIPSGTVL
jgi:glucose-1-phosphate adenylyltransferase